MTARDGVLAGATPLLKSTRAVAHIGAERAGVMASELTSLDRIRHRRVGGAGGAGVRSRNDRAFRAAWGRFLRQSASAARDGVLAGATPLLQRARAAGHHGAERALASLKKNRYLAAPGLAASAVLVPVAIVVYQSFLTAPLSQPNAQFGLGAYRLIFDDPRSWTALGTTMLRASRMTAIAVPLGAVFAFLVARTDLPGRAWFEPVTLFLLFIPALVLAFGYTAAADSTRGSCRAQCGS